MGVKEREEEIMGKGKGKGRWRKKEREKDRGQVLMTSYEPIYPAGYIDSFTPGHSS